MADETQAGAETKTRWGAMMGWVGGATALIGLFGSLAGGAGWVAAHHKESAERKAQMAVAQGMVSQGEYEEAVKSYGEILKGDKLNKAALDGQLDATMLWVEDFHSAGKDDESVANGAKAGLDEILGLLNAGLVRAQAEKGRGERRADVQAHLGWAHWMNQKIAEREFGQAAQQDWNKALAMDPKNVYAHAMLGNSMLQTGGGIAAAAAHFDTALATGRVRAYVFDMEMSGLVYNEMPGARAQIVKTANAMRKAGEPLEADTKQRLISTCCLPYMINHDELVEALSAVPVQEAWQSYLWLTDAKEGVEEEDTAKRDRVFVRGTLLEIAGRRAEALVLFQALARYLAKQPGTYQEAVGAEVKRLSGH